MTWEVFAGDDEAWDSQLDLLGNTSPFQSSAWAKFKSRDGWQVLRLLSSPPTAAVQFLIKRRGPIHVAWGPGGPIGEPCVSLVNTLGEAVRDQLRARALHLRISIMAELGCSLVPEPTTPLWSRPIRSVSSRHTLRRAIPTDSSHVGHAYSRNWHRNLRRGLDRLVVAEEWRTPEFSEIAALHVEVANIKQAFRPDWKTSEESLAALAEAFGDRLVLVRATRGDGTSLAVRGAIISGIEGLDFLAATSVDGRRCYASNVALDFLLRILSERGVRTYDFGGADLQRNPGVYNFKHGAGGMPVVYRGEFQYSWPKILGRLISSVMVLGSPN